MCNVKHIICVTTACPDVAQKSALSLLSPGWLGTLVYSLGFQMKLSASKNSRNTSSGDRESILSYARWVLSPVSLGSRCPLVAGCFSSCPLVAGGVPSCLPHCWYFSTSDWKYLPGIRSHCARKLSWDWKIFSPRAKNYGNSTHNHLCSLPQPLHHTYVTPALWSLLNKNEIFSHVFWGYESSVGWAL